MKSHYLHGSTLFITPRSPFARRVRLAFLENQLEFKEQVCDVFKPSQELISLNPLARIPILVTSARQVVIDSNLILQLLYESGTSTLMPENQTDRIAVFRWMGIAAGLCEKIVEYYINSLLPAGQRDGELEIELRQISERVLLLAENELQKNPAGWIVGPNLSQADLDVISALDYLKFRYSFDWEQRFGGVRNYCERLQQRPSIQQTRPVA